MAELEARDGNPDLGRISRASPQSWKIRRMEPSADVYSRWYGVLRRRIVQRPQRALAAALLIPGVRLSWRIWALKTRPFLSLRSLSAQHKQSMETCESNKGECRANLAAGQWLHWVHKYVAREENHQYEKCFNSGRRLTITPIGYELALHKGKDLWEHHDDTVHTGPP